MKTINIIKEVVTPHGFVLRTEVIEACGEQTEWTMAYSVDGHYIGDVESALRLCRDWGIAPQISKPENSVCSIGFSRENGKWYGWSHRAIFGFAIGSTCKEGDCHYLPESEGGRGEWTAQTVADAKQMAVDFASGVS